MLNRIGNESLGDKQRSETAARDLLLRLFPARPCVYQVELRITFTHGEPDKH